MLEVVPEEVQSFGITTTTETSPAPIDLTAPRKASRLETDTEVERLVKTRLRRRLVIFLICGIIIFLFCISVLYSASGNPEIQYIVKWVFVGYFLVVSVILWVNFKGSFNDYLKLLDIRKKGSVLPQNFKSFEQDEETWGKWD